MTRAIIIGGGISGLAAAYALERGAAARKMELSTTILEKDSRLGGKIWSIKEEGFLCEWGPNGFLDNKPMTLDLCSQLHVDDSLLRSNDNARKRFIYSEQMLHQLPESGPSFLKSKLMSWPGKFRIAGEMIVPARRNAEDESLADFARRRLGSEALDKLIAPMVSGIFAGDPEQMSLRSCFPRINELEQEYGGLIKAMMLLAKKKKAERKEGKQVASAAGPGGVLTSFNEGIQELTDATAFALKGEVRCDSEVIAVHRVDGGYKVELADGSNLESELVLCCSPSFALQTMTRELLPGLGKILNEIPYSPMNVVCFGYEREKISHSLDGFGYLIPRREGCHTLGTLWDSSIFPNRAPEGKVLLRSMLGGATNKGAIELSEKAVVEQVRADLKRIMEIDAAPDFVRVFRHEQAIPMYLVGHAQRVQAIEAELQQAPGLFVSGNAYYGVGLNDCVNASNLVAQRMITYLGNLQES